MGLDTYVDITIRPKNLPENSKRTIPLCYFRKCFSIANELEEQMKQYFNVSDGDFVSVKHFNSESDYDNDDLMEVLFEIRDILTEQIHRLCTCKSNEFAVDTYDAFWDVQDYLRCCYRNLMNIDLFVLFLNKQIDIGGLAEQLNREDTFSGFNPDDWEDLSIDECELGFEFCNSY